MSRYRRGEASVVVMAQGSRLLVRWVSATYWLQIRESWRGEGWRHAECSWSGRMRCWSVSVYGRARLESWLGATFEPGCIRWKDEQEEERSA